MVKTIFSEDSATSERSLRLNEDGTLTYRYENSGWKMVREGMGSREETLSADEAKRRWPQYAAKIDAELLVLQNNSAN
jgi:hypothetical protein